MSIQKIDVGNAANDLSGEALRDAFVTTNDNFAELNAEKASDSDVAVAVNNHASNGTHFPTGGTTGQIPVKASNNDYDVIWQTDVSGVDAADRAEQAADRAETAEVNAELAETNAEASAATASAAAAAACDPSAHGHTIAQVSDLSNQLGATEKTAHKGTPDGYPPLDGNSKIPTVYFPESITGDSAFIATWNATTNTPTVPAASTVAAGGYYVVSVAGTTDLDGIASWAIGDKAISTGTVWEKIPNDQAVISVNGATGVVVLDTDDLAEGSNLFYTEARVDARVTFETLDTNSDVGTGAAQLAAGDHGHTVSDVSDFTTAVDARITFETLDTNSDVGTGAAQVAAGDHGHTVSDVSDFTTAVDARITFETLDTNSDVGTGAAQLAAGDHAHLEADVTDLDKYTQAEVDTLIAAAVSTAISNFFWMGPTPPAADGVAKFWYDTEGLQLYVMYEDEDSVQPMKANRSC